MWDENKVRIVDVADALGLSTATVSNVIHGKTKKISDHTVRRVQEKLNEMGYIPNMAATLLAQNDSHIIGVVVNDHAKYEGHVLEDPFVCSAIKQRDHRDDDKACDHAEGACIDRRLQQLREGRAHKHVCKHHDGGKQVGKYLRGHNCLNVLFMADNRLSPDLDRYKGLCDGLGRKADFWEIPMYKEERIIYYTCRVKEFAGYGAVFAASDYYAIELLYFLMDNGYKVPDDIWIIGFDDITECVNVRPTLASVRQDVSYRARKAVEYLTCMKKDNDCSVTEKISVEFIPRDSCIQQPELSTVRNR